MRIVVSGGGPSGLYFALLARKYLPGAEVSVYEQNPEGATYGFGIVLAERGLDKFRTADRESHDAIMAASFMTRHRMVTVKGTPIFIEGGSYGGAISRLRLLTILQQCCERAGVKIEFEKRLTNFDNIDADLVVGGDGVNSALRTAYAEQFGTTSWSLGNKLAWYGTTRHFPYPILSFKSLSKGHFWCAAYPYDGTMGTFVAECDADAWERSGLSKLTDEERQLFAEDIFADELKGHKLISNKSNWHSLPVTRNREWHVGRNVLLGDALHSAHPTIGSGTRIAMEDSIALFQALLENQHDREAALTAFRRQREPQKQKLVTAAEKSFMWYEDVGPKIDALDPATFVFDFMTRTGRINEDRLRGEHPEFMARYAKEWEAFNLGAAAPERVAG